MARKDQKEHNKKMVEEHLSLSLSKLTAMESTENAHDLTEQVATIEAKIAALYQLTNSQSEQNAEKMKIVSHEMAAIKEKLAQEARNSGELIDQIKNNIMETKESFMQKFICAEEDTTKCKENITKCKEEVTKELK